MIKSVAILQPIRVEYENKVEIFFIDPQSEKVFNSSYEEIPGDLSLSIFSKMIEDQADETSLPLKEIYDVLSKEKKLSEENDKHIFRRS